MQRSINVAALSRWQRALRYASLDCDVTAMAQTLGPIHERVTTEMWRHNAGMRRTPSDLANQTFLTFTLIPESYWSVFNLLLGSNFDWFLDWSFHWLKMGNSLRKLRPSCCQYPLSCPRKGNLILLLLTLLVYQREYTAIRLFIVRTLNTFIMRKKKEKSIIVYIIIINNNSSYIAHNTAIASLCAGKEKC